MILWLVFLGLFLMCAGISVAFMSYIGVLWYATLREAAMMTSADRVSKGASKGLSVAELEMLPVSVSVSAAALSSDDGIGIGNECAVCLEDIEMGQTARVLPLCRHAFHRACADAWLTCNAVCPICRASPLPLPPPDPAV